jgi:hypothetical protein
MLQMPLKWFISAFFALAMFALMVGLAFFLREVHLAMYTVRIAVPHAFSELVVKATESRRFADNSPCSDAYAHSQRPDRWRSIRQPSAHLQRRF